MSYVRFGQIPPGVPAVQFTIPANPTGSYIQTYNTNLPLFPYVGMKPPPPLFERLWKKLF